MPEVVRVRGYKQGFLNLTGTQVPYFRRALRRCPLRGPFESFAHIFWRRFPPPV